ncbi:hypothetical protein N867_10075 [Actinotalea fermentans ATCC 43279 = JCM 9966 = DSM 3133]|nr:hypothetical protein N867_10075 [Actinotalea fermentans ATCC 43279 = JCM 9966 = DSM 3133]
MDDEHVDDEQVNDAAASDVSDLECSSRGCRAPAQWGLLWNNPRIHTPERRKVWLACDDHRERLERFLGNRSFLRDTVPVAGLAEALEGPHGAADEP